MVRLMSLEPGPLPGLSQLQHEYRGLKNPTSETPGHLGIEQILIQPSVCWDSMLYLRPTDYVGRARSPGKLLAAGRLLSHEGMGGSRMTARGRTAQGSRDCPESCQWQLQSVED